MDRLCQGPVNKLIFPDLFSFIWFFYLYFFSNESYHCISRENIFVKCTTNSYTEQRNHFKNSWENIYIFLFYFHGKYQWPWRKKKRNIQWAMKLVKHENINKKKNLKNSNKKKLNYWKIKVPTREVVKFWYFYFDINNEESLKIMKNK